MNTPQYQKAIQAAYNLLNKYNITEPPVRIDEIVSAEGLEVFEIDFAEKKEEVSGLLVPEEGTMYVNTDEPDNRQTFTIAHELGHWLLHAPELKKNKELGILYRKPLSELNNDPYEKEANCFAANLLVPFYLLNKYKSQSLETLARLFAVSEAVIGFRLQNMGYDKQRT